MTEKNKLKTKHKTKKTLIKLARNNKRPISSLINYFIPKSKIAIELFKKIAKTEGLLWDSESGITRYGKRHDIDIKIPSFYADKIYTKEEQIKIEKYEVLQESIKFLSTYYKIHFQIRIVLIKKNETKTWNDKCPSYEDLSKLDMMNISTISFSKRPSTSQRARKAAKK